MDNANSYNPNYLDSGQQVENKLSFNEDTITVADPIQLDIPDKDLLEIIDRRIKRAKEFYEKKYNLTERREKNERYLFGRQVDMDERAGKYKDYETRASDNVLYEIEETLKPLAMSKLPDILVTPGGLEPDRIQSSKDLTIVVNDVNRKREQRMSLGLAFKHLPVYFTGVLKARWNPELGTNGDYEFVVVHPEYIIVDETATSKNPDDMGFIAQVVPMTAQEMIMKFPSKKQEIYDQLKKRGIIAGDTPTWKEMASEVKMYEVWFDWYRRKQADEEIVDEDGNPDLVNEEEMEQESILEPGIKWQKVSGVLWKYEDLLLDKMVDPNYDHEGEEKLFTYLDPQDESSKTEVKPEELLMMQLQGIPLPKIQKERIYHNYFKRCKKPYYFFGYDQWGKIYLDETSRIEQNLRDQESLDSQNKTIGDQLKKREKHIWSKDSGMDKAAVQRLDMDDPKMDVIVDNDPNAVHKSIAPERPDQAQFAARGDTRDRMYAKSGSTAVRGQQQSDVATTNQIAREADYTRSDDLVEDTINAACEWMAEWQMQFIMLRYTSEHMKEIVGAKGEMTYVKLRRDTPSDGMEVIIKASATDKLKAQRNAMDTAKLGPPYTNPLDFFTDMDMSDPEGRAERGMMLALDPQGYFTKYILGLQNPQAMAGALNGQPAQGGQSLPPQGQPNQAPPETGAPQLPSAQDTTNVPTEPPQPQQAPQI